MIERVLEKAMRVASGAEVTTSRSEATPVNFENDRLRSIRSSEGSSVALRVVVDGRLGNSFTNDMEDEDGLVERALESARYGAPVSFEFPGSADAPMVRTFDPEIPGITREELVRLGREMLEQVKAYNPELLVDAGASRSFGRAELLNSAGARIVEEGTSFSVGAHAQRVRGTDILAAGYGKAWRSRAPVDHRAVAERAIRKFRLAERDATITSADYPVIFRPGATSVLLAAVRMGVNGRNVLKGDSPLAGRLGERIVDERLTLTDDPLIDFAGGSSRWDSEGVPRQRLAVLEKGVLCAFLYDLDTAAKAGTRTTGHGIGGGFTNAIFAPGDVPYAEMVKGIREGLIVDGVIGAGQSNVMNGDFAVNVSLGYKVENGEIVGRVKNAMIAGNAYTALNALEAVAADPEWAGSSSFLPALLVGKLAVTAR